MANPSDPGELRGLADLAGIADVIDVRDGHALITFVNVFKGKPRRHPDDPFPQDLPGTAAVDLASTDGEIFRVGLRVRTHLVRGSVAFRGGIAWDANMIWCRTPAAPIPSVGDTSPGWRRHTIPDPLCPGEAAASFVLPDDWRAEGWVSYNPGNPYNAGLVFARAVSLDGSQACEFLPNEHFGGDLPAGPPRLVIDDLPDDLWDGGEVKVGGLVFGRRFHPTYFAVGRDPLRDHIIPRYRSDVGSVRRPYRVAYHDDTAEVMHDFCIAARDGYRYRAHEEVIAYAVGGVAIEERFLAVAYSGPAQHGLLDVRAYRLAAGAGAGARHECIEVLRSFRPDSGWLTRCRAMQRRLAGGDTRPILATCRTEQEREAREVDKRERYFAWPARAVGSRAEPRPDASEPRRVARGEAFEHRRYYADPARADRSYRDERCYRVLWTDGEGRFAGSDDPGFTPAGEDGVLWTRAIPLLDEEIVDATV